MALLVLERCFHRTFKNRFERYWCIQSNLKMNVNQEYFRYILLFYYKKEKNAVQVKE